MKRVCLVSCVSKKLPNPSPAGELYASALFQKSRAYALKNADDWFILSAKHGLLHPAKVIAPYDVTLNKMGVSERRLWAAKVHDQILKAIPSPATFILLAGKKYSDDLIPLLKDSGYKIEEPLEGFPIGKRLQWFNENL